MHHYVIYGLRIQSQIPFSWLLEAGDGSDVKIVLGDSPQHLTPPLVRAKRHEIKDDELLLRNECGRVWLRRTLVVITPAPNFDADSLTLLLLGSGMAALLAWRQQLLLHASAILLPNGSAIAFAGDKNAGKSTLAGFFYHDGHPLISDDVSALVVNRGQVWIHPGFPRLKLDPAILQAMGKDPTDYPLLPLKSRVKHSYPAISRFEHAPVRLQTIYLLEEGATNAVFSVAPKDAAVQLMRHRYRPELSASPDQQQTALIACGAAARAVSVCRLMRPKNLASIAATIGLLIAASTAVSSPTEN